MRDSSARTPERRRDPRTKLVEIAYIGMGPENGGLVLDVSDGGLSFHAVAAVEQAETIRFLLSLRGHSRIEGAGEVVWTNETRTVCGLRFTSLSGGAREHLNNWTNQSQPPAAARRPSISDGLPAVPQSEALPAAKAPASTETSRPVFAIPPGADFYSSETLGDSPWKDRLHWVLVGLLVVAFMYGGYKYGVHVGEVEILSGAPPATESGPQSEPPTVAPVPADDTSAGTGELATPVDAAAPAVDDATPSPTLAQPAPTVETSVPAGGASIPNAGSVPGSSLVNASKTNIPTKPTLPPPGGLKHRADAADEQTVQAVDSGKSEFAAALASLNGDNGRRDSAKAVHELWTAVADGNSEAEVFLAELYATGDGVLKNCEQARVLLMAASKGGNAEAKVKLDELDTDGCP